MRRDVVVACSALLLAWVVVFSATIGRETSDTRWLLLSGAAFLILSSAGTLISAIWLKLERRAPGDATLRRLVDVFLLVFVALGAVSAWSARLRPDVFRALYVIVLLTSLYILNAPVEASRTRASVRVVSAWVFGAVAAAHVVRLLMHAPVSIGWWSVPEWISVVAVFVAAALAFWNTTDRGVRFP